MALKIGLFDSGFGGISVLLAMRRLLPDPDVYYFADQEYMPYGDKSQSQIQERAKKISTHLLNQGVDLIVVACNTATVLSIDNLRDNFSIPFVGIEPFVKAVTREPLQGHKQLGILLTESSARSQRVKDLIKAWDKESKIQVIPLPGLVPLIENYHLSEENELDSKQLHHVLAPAISSSVEGFILGCTHYPLIRPQIEFILKRPCFSPCHAVAKQIERVAQGLKCEAQNRRGQIFFSKSLSGPWSAWSEKELWETYPHLENDAMAWPI